MEESRAVNSRNQFFGAMRDKKLSREKQQGLFAELKFLNLISSDQISNHNAVESWKTEKELTMISNSKTE